MTKLNGSATIHLFLLLSIFLFTLSNGFVLQELPLYREERNMKQLEAFFDAAKRGFNSRRIHPFAPSYYIPSNYRRKFDSEKYSGEIA
ncbi:Hypothetical protein SRAE_X000132500 [Strongyloides ratti]|uniref:Uncharacterized protein n=1 Tax=Strongyloides ratti TaxID=34506 RepID=A0A090KPU3_STRRB|nr:Hypothetical protein SRAE_X000132500 [Strongyloides ratti]CEF59578.1 Hypothetical protein SRAE_X000132500 [Strongyloides ratti]